jgi:endo-1,4-beta-xylanase
MRNRKTAGSRFAARARGCEGGPARHGLPLLALVVSVAVSAAVSVLGCIIQQRGDAAVVAVGGGAAPALPAQSLRKAAQAAHRLVGTALMSGQLDDAQVRTLVASNFDSLTPENEMKWEAIEPQPGVFSFAGGDKLVAFAADNGIRMRGHTLVWHSQLAPWVKGLSRDELRAAIRRHIGGVVGHYKGKVAVWDVVNEAIADGPGGELRGDSPFNALGPTFIDDAFKLAHEADPAALLFYNDYEIEGEGTAKSDAAFRLCKRLKEAGVPIDGVGMQMHVDPRHWPSAESIRRNMQRYAALGLRIEITEMDVPVGEIPGTIAEKLQQQRIIAHDIVAACVAVDACAAITFWGWTDRESWLNSPQWGALRGRLPHYPLPFNAAYQPKPMVTGVLDALAGR